MSRPYSSAITLAAAMIASLCGISASAQAAAGAPFLPHQAIYELSLIKSRGSTSIESARGRILYNFSGSRYRLCESAVAAI